MKPCTPHVQSHSYSVEGKRVLLNGHVLGTVNEVLAEVDSWIDVQKWTVPCKPEWSVCRRTRKKVLVTEKEVVHRSIEPPATWLTRPSALGVIAEACGLRRLDLQVWRVTAPNACLHPQFGPCVPVATDGTWTVLWSRPWPGCDWLLAHTSNVIGPVTSTPTALWEWTKDGLRGRSTSGAVARSARVDALMALV